MATFYVHVESKVYSCFQVEADSEEQAVAKFQEGEDTIHLEELDETISDEITEVSQ